MTVRLVYVNILARDIEALSGFYAAAFGFSEIEGHRSPIYRCLDAGGVELGFNAPLARGLLNIKARDPARGDGLATFITFEAASIAELEDAFGKAVSLGARVLKEPYDTYYNARQCVLQDPEGNVFRLNVRKGPRQPADDVREPPWAQSR